MTTAPGTTTPPPPDAALGEAGTRPTAARRDLVALMILGLLTFALARHFDLLARLVAGARALGGAAADALIVTVLALAFALKVYAWRRWREARRELAARARAEAALRASDARLGLLTRQLPAFLWTTDADLRLASFSGGGFRRGGIDPRGRVGKTVAEFFGTADPAFPPLAAHRRPLAGASAEYLLCREGRDYAVYVEPLRDAAGAIVGCLGLGVDVTERERDAASLRDSEARFRALFEGAAIGIGLSDLERRPLMVYPALARFTGYDSAEEMRRPIPQATHPDDLARDRALYAELVAGRRDHYQLEKRYVRKDGAAAWGRLTTSLVRDAAGAPQYVIGMVEDITARVAAEAGLGGARRRLAAAREEERLNLARELHDDAIQDLLGIRLALQLGRSALDREGADPATLALLDEGQCILQEVVERLRRITGGLRPAGLEELGLVAALEGYAAHVRRKEAGADLPVELDLDPDGATVPPMVARALFRVGQEGLRNARRHAGAQRAIVTLRVGVAEATLRVADDGCGFAPPPDLTALARAGHFGLVGLAEQLADLGGALAITSRPGAGTTLTARAPLTSGEGDDG